MHPNQLDPGGSDTNGELVDFIINLPLFEYLERDELIDVAARMDFIDLDPGEVLFNAWDKMAFEDILSKKVNLGVNILKGLANLLSINLKKTSSRLADNMLPMG
ncbi:MAG: hypothetical protein KFF68_12285 [Desulfosarcina sp.]|nr:hypothetical protein [Desulfosarcina sp.]